ncbi:hypothetical protein [Burkholderia vietnamiensis]|uniref:hypothetical protein n=1 Tax=Burkholderia vietnamiensis TaxID=60552 RepID=UPI002654CD8F|nr:hypothetical protein [Burkholderia vietnamiensis]MDN8037429.1 hypothetical protein [Burkholderia vietnamiensis]
MKKQYYGGYFVNAQPMTRGEYASTLGKSLDDNTPGYLAEIPSFNNHSSWVPANFFDKFFKVIA